MFPRVEESVVSNYCDYCLYSYSSHLHDIISIVVTLWRVIDAIAVDIARSRAHTAAPPPPFAVALARVVFFFFITYT